MVRIAGGIRTLPPKLNLKDALIGVMRSIASAWGQRAIHDIVIPMQPAGRDVQPRASIEGVESVTPERIHSAQERLDRIHQAFQHDPEGTMIVRGLELGMTGPELQRCMDISDMQFRAAQKRVYRMLLKLEGPYA
jgi:hypothetical protein